MGRGPVALEQVVRLPLEGDGPDVLDRQRLRGAEVQGAGAQVLGIAEQPVQLRRAHHNIISLLPLLNVFDVAAACSCFAGHTAHGQENHEATRMIMPQSTNIRRHACATHCTPCNANDWRLGKTLTSRLPL